MLTNDQFRPEELDFPNTMTDIDYHTWMLSGSAVMRDGQVIPEKKFFLNGKVIPNGLFHQQKIIFVHPSDGS